MAEDYLSRLIERRMFEPRMEITIEEITQVKKQLEEEVRFAEAYMRYINDRQTFIELLMKDKTIKIKP